MCRIRLSLWRRLSGSMLQRTCAVLLKKKILYITDILNVKKEVIMKKTIIISLSFFLIAIIAISCQITTQNKLSDKQKSLSELQIEACNSADAAKTCDTRLPEVGIVLKEDCCKVLGKCC